MPFNVVKTLTESGVLVVKMAGTMTMGNQLQGFEWELVQAAKDSRNRIVLDMAEITYMDSSAIGVLAGCHGAAKNSGGQLRMAAVSERVRVIFKMTGMDMVFHLDPTLEASIGAIAPGETS